MDNYCHKNYIVRYHRYEDDSETSFFVYESDSKENCQKFIDKSNMFKKENEEYELIDNKMF